MTDQGGQSGEAVSFSRDDAVIGITPNPTSTESYPRRRFRSEDPNPRDRLSKLMKREENNILSQQRNEVVQQERILKLKNDIVGFTNREESFDDTQRAAIERILDEDPDVLTSIKSWPDDMTDENNKNKAQTLVQALIARDDVIRRRELMTKEEQDELDKYARSLIGMNKSERIIRVQKYLQDKTDVAVFDHAREIETDMNARIEAHEVDRRFLGNDRDVVSLVADVQQFNKDANLPDIRGDESPRDYWNRLKRNQQEALRDIEARMKPVVDEAQRKIDEKDKLIHEKRKEEVIVRQEQLENLEGKIYDDMRRALQVGSLEEYSRLNNIGKNAVARIGKLGDGAKRDNRIAGLIEKGDYEAIHGILPQIEEEYRVRVRREEDQNPSAEESQRETERYHASLYPKTSRSTPRPRQTAEESQRETESLHAKIGGNSAGNSPRKGFLNGILGRK